MKAAILHGPDDLRIDEVPEPTAGPDEALIKVEAATTCGQDLRMLAGDHPVLGDYPSAFGHEMAGTVVEASGGLPVGSRVGIHNLAVCGSCPSCRRERTTACTKARYLLGGFADLLVAPVRQLVPLRQDMPFVAAALADQLACAIHAIRRAEARIDDRLAVVGAGPMGLLLADLAVRGAAEVTVVDPVPKRLELAALLGADTVEGTAADLEPRSFDIVLEAVGTEESWQQATAAVAPAGAVIVVGDYAHGAVAKTPADAVHFGEIDILGAFHHTLADYNEALDLIGAGRVDWEPLIGQEIGLDELPEALASNRAAGPLKLVVRPDSGI